VNIYMALVTVGIVLATFTTRATLLLAPRFKLSPRVEAGLRFAPVCALAVLVVPAVVVQDGAVNLSFANPYLVAALAATASFLWTLSMVVCIAVGMFVMTAFRLL
jgi:branched-subunit amino acid transport protein